MKMKKTWLSYPLWLLYAVVTGVLIAGGIGIQVWQFGQYLTAAVIGLVFGGIIGVWFAGRQLACLTEKWTEDKHLANMLECFLALCLCAAAILYRFYLILHFDESIKESSFYDMAMVKSDGGVPEITHGASYLYTVCLSFVLSFTGNKVAAGVMLQMILQVIAIFLFYFAVRLLVGRIEAICALVIVTFAERVCSEMFSLAPETLYFLLYAFGLLLCGLYGKMECATDETGNGVGSKGRHILLAICGFYIGFAGFLDVTGWTLLFSLACICMRRGIQGEEKKSDVLIRLAVCGVISLASAFLFLGIDAVSSGHSYGEALSVWMEILKQNFLRYNKNFFTLGADSSPIMGLFIHLCGALAIIGFWFQKVQKQDVWIIMLLILSAWNLCGIGGMEYGIFLTAIWGVLAGIGIRSMGKAEEMSQAAGIKDVQEPEKNPWIPDLVVEEWNEDEPKVKFIDNPLPLPKKHVKREMTYAKELEGEEMEFDVSVGEEDDFDI